jgi:hypothetical protein
MKTIPFMIVLKIPRNRAEGVAKTKKKKKKKLIASKLFTY